MKSLTLFALLFPILACPACELLYLPPATWVVFPVAEVSDNSAPIPELNAAVKGNEAILERHSVAVLANPARGAWGSRVDDEVLDEREDENRLLAEYLEDLDLFAEVTVIDRLAGCSADFVVSCSVDCMYTIELDGLMYVWNCMTLGLGFLIGWPHQDSAAFYVGRSGLLRQPGRPARGRGGFGGRELQGMVLRQHLLAARILRRLRA